MYPESSYVVDAVTNDVELHVFISADCDLTDDEIRNQVASPNGVDEKWFIGAHLVNLDKFGPYKRWMDSISDTLVETANELRAIRRAAEREDPDVRVQQGSEMFSTGDQIDQNGTVGPPRNFKRKLDEQAKYDLMAKNDHILDGIVVVKPSFLFVKLTSDYTRGIAVVGKVLEGRDVQTSCHARWYLPVLSHA